MATNFSNNNISAIKIQDKKYNLKAIPFHGTEAEWNTIDYIPKEGEIIIVNLEDGNIRFKIGDGSKTYAELPFEDEAIRQLINEKSAVTIETWDNADSADTSITIGNLVINKIKNQTIYNEMRAAGKVDENELYLIEDDHIDPVTVTPSLNSGIAIGTITVEGIDYVLYAPEINCDDKAPIDSPNLTGVPTAPTAAIGTNNTQIATTAFVASATINTIFDGILIKDMTTSETYILKMNNGNLVSELYTTN